jgi:hypothetical protein
LKRFLDEKVQQLGVALGAASRRFRVTLRGNE